MVTITEVSSVDHGQQPREVPQGQGRAREQVQRPDKRPPGLESYAIGLGDGDEHNREENNKYIQDLEAAFQLNITGLRQGYAPHTYTLKAIFEP